MIEYFKLALSRYAEFTGRSRRSEYWYFYLVTQLIQLGLGIIGTIVDSSLVTGIGSIASLAFFIPSLAVGVRRLHDIGKSGWWLLIALTGIGIFLLIYWFVQDSEPGANEYGPNPKTGAVAGNDVTRHLVD